MLHGLNGFSVELGKMPACAATVVTATAGTDRAKARERNLIRRETCILIIPLLVAIADITDV